MFAQQHRQRIGFFARRAAKHPDAQAVAGVFALKQPRNHLFLEEFELAAVAKELGDADQQVVEQLQRLVETIAQYLQILLQGFNLCDLHAPLHAAQEGGALVTMKIVAGGIAQDGGDLAELVALATVAHTHR